MGKNDNDVNIKITDFGDKSGVKIDFYDKDPREKDHKSIHLKVDYENKSYTTIDNVNGEKETSSGSCYLTTACMRHHLNKFDDNCLELKTLRWFRDYLVSKEDVEHYYKTAPIILDAINNTPKNDLIYKNIYDFNGINLSITGAWYAQRAKALEKYMRLRTTQWSNDNE